MDSKKLDPHKKVVGKKSSSLRFKLLFLIPTFLIATILGFCIEILFFEKINLEKISKTLKDSYLINPYQSESDKTLYHISVEQSVVKDHSDESESLIWQDVHSLLDIGDFNFLVNEESICSISSNHEGSKILLILISSERDHFKERLAFRQTYGSAFQLQDVSVRIVFLLGTAKPAEFDENPFDVDNETINALLDIQDKLNAKEDEMIHKEHSIYRDLVMGNFVDNSNNVVYKHLMGYKWVLNFCPWASYVLKLDDNIFVNLHRLISNERFSFHNNFLSDLVQNSTLNDHEIISEDNQCNMEGENFPAFCPARFYGISPDWILKIYTESQKYKHPCTNDDGFITGILREKAAKSYEQNSVIVKLRTVVPDKAEENSIMDVCKNTLHGIHRHSKDDDRDETVISLQTETNVAKNLVCLWNNMLEQSNFTNKNTEV